MAGAAVLSGPHVANFCDTFDARLDRFAGGARLRWRMPSGWPMRWHCGWPNLGSPMCTALGDARAAARAICGGSRRSDKLDGIIDSPIDHALALDAL